MIHRLTVALAALAAVAVTAAPALAANYHSNLYADASWYEKYQEVSTAPTPLCSSNTGAVQQLSYGSNVDASHECGSQSETAIAINPANAKNVIAGSNEIQRLPMRAMVSSDGGKTFTGVDLPLPPPVTNNGFDFGSDPNLAFDSAGNAYYSYIVVFFSAGGAINGTEMALAHSTDGGKTWSALFFNAQSGEGQFNDKPYVAVDTTRSPDRVYVAWDNATGSSSSTLNGNNLLVAYSDDGGASVSTPVVASGDFKGATGAIGADPYVTANGTLHVAWQDYAHLTIADASSTDGVHFSSPSVITLIGGFDLGIPAQGNRGALVYPACGSYASSLYCSYSNGSDTSAKVYVAKSTDGGKNWASTQMPAGGDQFNQWLAVDPSNGSVDVAYYDTGTTGATATVYTLARSTDGGATYAKSAIANAPTDETCCAPSVNLGNQYGDYEGIAAYGGIVRPVWTDRRQAVIDLGLREEVFTATLKP